MMLSNNRLLASMRSALLQPVKLIHDRTLVKQPHKQARTTIREQIANDPVRFSEKMPVRPRYVEQRVSNSNRHPEITPIDSPTRLSRQDFRIEMHHKSRYLRLLDEPGNSGISPINRPSHMSRQDPRRQTVLANIGQHAGK